MPDVMPGPPLAGFNRARKKMKKIYLVFSLVFFLTIVLSACFSYVASAEGDELRLEMSSAVKKTSKSRVRVAGHTTPGATVKMYVNGSDQGKVKIKRKGKISKWVVLNAMGDNEIIVTAENESGTKSVTLSVERQAKRAIDRPLQIDIIHSDNVTDESIVKIWGLVNGVSEVKVEVDDFEWGWAVVKKTSGKYKMEVRLNEGLNTVKVTATKGEDYVTATKVIQKI
jgi:hypothetical protein